MDAPLPPVLPPPMLSAAEVQTVKDAEHLRLLSYAYYFVGGFTALISSLGLIHFFIGLAVLLGGFPTNAPHHRPRHTVPSSMDASADPTPAPDAGSASPDAAPAAPDAEPPAPDDRQSTIDKNFPDKAFGILFMVLGGGFVLLGWTVGGLTIYAGRCLRDRKHRVFTLVIAGLNCLHMPFGTMMGVFTFIVLGRPTVEALYRRPLPPGPTPLI